jgi:hypothetical protein
MSAHFTFRDACSYCYTRSNGGTQPIILRVDNCPAHLPPPEATRWKCGALKGYKLSNILLIFSEPNCTSKVYPLNARYIKSFKALYRKRDMSRMLDQLNAAEEEGTDPGIRCNLK